ncbi:MAG: 4Fe-4S ferredoxin [Treponema sp. CETP13]|nr:MAG: 4Fe-4S ferredoxin [Treponema sp. CETP13]
MIKVSEAKLNDVFAAIAAKQALYMPVEKKDGEAEYAQWAEGVEYSRAQNTVRSAKDFFFPKKEDLYEIKGTSKNFKVIDSHEKIEDFVVFGVKACDAKAFSLIDRVYLNQNPVDSYYENRRKHGTVITMACNEAAPTCFCKLFDIDAANPSNGKDGNGKEFPIGDISTWMNDGNVWFEAKTEKGTKLLDSIKAELTSAGADMDAETAPVEKLKDEITAVMDSQKFANQNLSKFTHENLNPIFNSETWKHMAESCLGCGTCTYVCPTCMCYNIKDMDTGTGIKRFRTWDSCMYSDFTKMAAANPRTQQYQKFRQRFMHKLVYYPARYENTFACVGCGRCLQKCPTHNNIIKVIETINADDSIKGDK